MKQFLITILGVLCCLPIMADNTATVEPLIIKAGETQTVEVSLLNSDPITNIQFQLLLPEGLKVTDVTCDESLPDMWDAGIKANMGSPWKAYFGETNGRMHILLTSGNARYKNESGVMSDFDLSLSSSKTIMKVTFTADETYDDNSQVIWNYALATNTKQTGIVVAINDLTPTTIEGVENYKAENSRSGVNGKVYTIQGVLVQNPTQPGIYIKNGKKYIVK